MTILLQNEVEEAVSQLMPTWKGFHNNVMLLIAKIAYLNQWEN